MANFYNLTVADIYKETKDCSVITFDVPEELKPLFQFQQGQHLTLKKDINGEDVRRSYSLCSSPLENKWQVAVKKINGGLFSSFVNEKLKKGDVVDVMPPNGTFHTQIEPQKAKNYIAFAAGSGITPILSIIKTHLAAEPNATFKLFYLNRSVKSIIFKEEIEQLKNVYFNRFEIFHFLTKEHRSAELFNGRFTKEKINILTDKIIDVSSTDACFICGPEDMIFSVKEFLESNGVAEKKIHFELFTTPGQNKKSEVRSTKYESNGPQSNITVKLDGRSFDFSIPLNSDTSILDAAMQQGADVPYACKGGVCCTCKAKLLEGEVKMDVHWGLEQEEIEQGYILTCQAHPVTANVTVDFDVK